MCDRKSECCEKIIDFYQNHWFKLYFEPAIQYTEFMGEEADEMAKSTYTLDNLKVGIDKMKQDGCASMFEILKPFEPSPSWIKNPRHLNHHGGWFKDEWKKCLDGEEFDFTNHDEYDWISEHSHLPRIEEFKSYLATKGN